MTRRRPPRRWRGLILEAKTEHPRQLFNKVRLSSNRPINRTGIMPELVDMGDDYIHHAIWVKSKVVTHRGPE